MSGRIDIERSLDQFLAEGPETVADRALQHALDEIDRTTQRRGLSAPWRLPLMIGYSRLAAAALIAVVVLGGALYLLGPRSNVGPPRSTAAPSLVPTVAPSLVPAPTPVPSPDVPGTPYRSYSLDTATWTRYPVSRYGYSLAYPAGWATAPAIVFWVPESRFEFWSSDGNGSDRFISPGSRAVQVHLTAMAADLGVGVTDADWIDGTFEHLPTGMTNDCPTTSADMAAITIDGREGRISTTCEMAAFLLVDRRMYIFSVDTDDEALFRAFLSTFRLSAPSAS